MTEEIFREKMLENGWEHDEIDEILIMHHWKLLYGIDMPLEDEISPRIVVESFPHIISDENLEYMRKLAGEHSCIFGYDVTEVCPKVKKLLAHTGDIFVSANLEEALEKSIRDKFDYLPRKYRYTADSKNQHIMTESEFREKMKSYGWHNIFTDSLVKLHDIQEEKHNIEIPFNYYLFEKSSN